MSEKIKERRDELEDLLRELRDAAQNSSHAYEVGNLGASRLHDEEAVEVKAQILMIFDDLMAAREKTRELVDRLDGYNLECEGGPMRNCVEWIDLKKTVEDKS